MNSSSPGFKLEGKAISVILGHPPKTETARVKAYQNDIKIIVPHETGFVITFPNGHAENASYQTVRSDARLSDPKPVTIKFSKDKKTFTARLSGFRNAEVWTFEIKDP